MDSRQGSYAAYREWPVDYGVAYLAALNKCTDAMLGTYPWEQARDAFAAAIAEARVKNKVEGISIPWLREQEGLIAFYPGKPIDPREREFWMISIWKDVESIKKAAGHEWQQPILLEDEADLVETVEIHHFEIFGNKHT